MGSDGIDMKIVLNADFFNSLVDRGIRSIAFPDDWPASDRLTDASLLVDYAFARPSDGGCRSVDVFPVENTSNLVDLILNVGWTVQY